MPAGLRMLLKSALVLWIAFDAGMKQAMFILENLLQNFLFLLNRRQEKEDFKTREKEKQTEPNLSFLRLKGEQRANNYFLKLL